MVGLLLFVRIDVVPPKIDQFLNFVTLVSFSKVTLATLRSITMKLLLGPMHTTDRFRLEIRWNHSSVQVRRARWLNIPIFVGVLTPKICT